ncbi:lanthionine synthetase C family protein [Pedobacter sp. CFBP9032]|uniref:lanthionine synthetase C family protein n=1 Tax=Pedobacter sp. CFBP9032 TaxID=3096539 RepID=UPI002A6A1132|nr:lanthionine synthetase C family protein [Pedobacter sp. CFBP9032]MDY0905125.1 lanthionine synthetase C family protein [Pedobacter sp. CFBP9032]
MWKTLLEDLKTVDKIHQIADELSTVNYSTLKPGLMNGTVGICLFYFYYEKCFSNKKYHEKANEIFEITIEKIHSEWYSSTHCSGLAGIFWAIDLMVKEGFLELEYDKEDIHECIVMEMGIYNDSKNFDFLHGADGIWFYLQEMELSSSEEVRSYINLIISNSIVSSRGITWHTSLDSIPLPVANLSLAHGVSSRIILLARQLETDCHNQELKRLLIASVEFLLSCQNNQQTYNSCFPGYVSEDFLGMNSRLGWCYGDLGNAIAIYRASIALKSDKLLSKFKEIAICNAKRRDLKINKVFDAGLCHGTAGIAHIFNRFYQWTDELIYKDAAEYWYNKTITQATFKNGLAGYKAYSNPEYKEVENVIEGVAGIGLILISSISNIEPKWDRAFLIS